jgi:hypothetical protein
MENLPNFLIIGAQKAGTTALHYYLNQHPQIYMSPVKEPGFFAFEGHLPSFQGPGDAHGYRFITTEFRDYQTLFQDVGQEKAIGESSTWYLCHPQAPGRIKHYLPHVKLIAILRNPVDRAYSSYQHLVRDERETIQNFSVAIDAEAERIAANWEYLWHYSTMGFYAAQLARYFELFDRRQIKIFLYEELSQSPQQLLDTVYDFLEVDAGYYPEVFTRLNVSGKRKSKTLDYFLYQKNIVKDVLKPLMPNYLRKSLANYVRRKNITKDECPPEARTKLVEIFRDDILHLQDFLQRDLSSWLEVK